MRLSRLIGSSTNEEHSNRIKFPLMPHNSKSLATLNQSKKKIDVTLVLSIIAKEKSDRIAKSENFFGFLRLSLFLS